MPAYLKQTKDPFTALVDAYKGFFNSYLTSGIVVLKFSYKLIGGNTMKNSIKAIGMAVSAGLRNGTPVDITPKDHIRVTGKRRAYKYWDTDIVKFNPETRTLTLNSGGFRTDTTKDRINAVLQGFGLTVEVYRSEKVWYVKDRDRELGEFKDGMKIAL